MIERGEVWWANLPESRGSEPGFRRPLLIVQADSFNLSRMRTVVAITVTSNLRLNEAPGNVFMRAEEVGLPKDSVANVSQIITIDRDYLVELAGRAPGPVLAQISRGLRTVLDL